MVRFVKNKAVGGAGCDARRLKSFINAILTVVTLHGNTFGNVPLGSAPGAGNNAAFTADTKLLVDENDTVGRSFLNSSAGACRQTPGFFTVEAGHKHICCLGAAVIFNRSHLYNLVWFGSHTQTLVDFTLHLAGTAGNTFFIVMKKIIMAHDYPPIKIQVINIYNGILGDWLYFDVNML